MNRRSLMIGGGAVLVAAGAGTLAWTRSVGSMADYDDYAARLRASLPAAPGIRDIVRFASLAANGHNTQPWSFQADDASIRILPDLSRRTPIVDPDNHHLFVSLGCAAENLAIAAPAMGRPGDIVLGEGDTAARFVFSDGPATIDPLLAAIPKRQSTRSAYDGRAVPTADLAALAKAGAMEGVSLMLVTDRGQIAKIHDLILLGNDAQMGDPAFLAELKAWIRFNPRSAAATGDGLFSAASGSPNLPTLLGPRFFDLFVTAKGERDRYAKQIDTASGLAVFVGDSADPLHWMKVGRACQRFALTATSLGLKHSFVNQPVEVASLRPALAALLGVPGKRPDLVMRFGYAPELPFSPRRPVEAIMA